MTNKVEHGKHPNSLKNLKKFEKGCKRSPRAGYQKGVSISVTASLKRALDMDYTQMNEYSQQLETRALREWIGIALCAKAMKGDVAAIREILDRTEGKAAQKIEVSGRDGDALKIENLGTPAEVWERASRIFEGVATKKIEEKDD